METKICTRCKIEKHLSDFYKSTQRSYQSNCKLCDKLRLREHRQKNTEYYRIYYRIYYRNVKEKQRKLFNQKKFTDYNLGWICDMCDGINKPLTFVCEDCGYYRCNRKIKVA